MKHGTITAMARPSAYGHTSYRRGGVDWPILDVGSDNSAKTVDVYDDPVDGALTLSGLDDVVRDTRMVVEGNALALERASVLRIEQGHGCAFVKPGSLSGLAGPGVVAPKAPAERKAPEYDRASLLARAAELDIEHAEEMADAILAEAIANAEALAGKPSNADAPPKRGGRRKKDAGD